MEEIKLSLDTVIYSVFTLAMLTWFFIDLFTKRPGSAFLSGKRKGEMGLLTLAILIIWIIFTVIWGGIFWW